jgi:S-adenosylmethionine:tRNA ribosyltransferase-isomerase
MNAAIPATREDGSPLTMHLSTHLPADLWVVELRSPTGTEPLLDGEPAETLRPPRRRPGHPSHTISIPKPTVRRLEPALDLNPEPADKLERISRPVRGSDPVRLRQ